MPGEIVLRALGHVYRVLEGLNVPMAVMGGIALAAWKHVRATRDVDLLVAMDEGRIETLLPKLMDASVRPKRQPPILTVGQLRILQLLYAPPEAFLELQIDLLLAESAYHRQALARRTLARLPDLDMQVFVLTCEDLILHKLLAGRLIDRADAAALLRANRPLLDLSHLLHWTNQLGLAAALAEVWNDAFPGEKPPVRSS